MLPESNARIASSFAVAAPGFMTRLSDYSAEVTTPDRRSLDRAASLMPREARVYVAALPKDTPDRQIRVCSQVRDLGLIPVPHIVARNIPNRDALDNLLGRLAREAGVDRALILGGDRDVPAGDFDCSLQVIESGLLQKHGIDKIAIACYPEGHPRIPEHVLDRARADKIVAARAGGLSIILISQVCFESEPIIRFLRKVPGGGRDGAGSRRHSRSCKTFHPDQVRDDLWGWRLASRSQGNASHWQRTSCPARRRRNSFWISKKQWKRNRR